MTASLSLTKVHRAQPGWYRGDFHAHTTASDGGLKPHQFADLARSNGLDFVTITDHNSIDAHSDLARESGVLILPGLEMTLFEGDYNVFGIEGMLEWMRGICVGKLRFYEPLDDGRTVNAFMRDAGEHGLVNSINHPLLNPLGWNDPDTDLRLVHCMEICNDPSFPDNDEGNVKALALWTDLLNAGHRLTALGGSDYHVPVPRDTDPAGKPPEVLGLPSTYVYATELSGAAILAAVCLRRAYLTTGPTVEFDGRVAGMPYGIGDDAGEIHSAITLRAKVQGAKEPGVARIVKNGQTLAEAPLVDGGAELVLHDPPTPGAPAWYRLDVWGEPGRPYGPMMAVTNPIFTGPQIEPERHRFGDFVSAAA